MEKLYIRNELGKMEKGNFGGGFKTFCGINLTSGVVWQTSRL